MEFLSHYIPENGTTFDNTTCRSITGHIISSSTFEVQMHGI